MGRAASATDGLVRVEQYDRVVTVCLERPPLNVMNLDLLAKLDGALAEVASMDGLQMVVVRGGGDRAFSAGVAIEDHVPALIGDMLERFHGALRRLFALEAPTVAAVDGHCLGGGMELAAVCDLVLATERSGFGQPEIKLGCFPPVAAVLYPEMIGAGKTYDLLLTGRTLDCAAAEAAGFVSRRLPDGGLEQGLSELRDELAQHSAAALRLTKKAIRLGQRKNELFERALAASERLYLDELAGTADMVEGTEAFLARRPPVWTHR